MSVTGRCAPGSEEAGEQQVGTASTWAACLMVEENGPWGPKVLHDSRLSAALRERLDGLGVRVLLVRRHGRYPERGTVRAMASWSSAEGSWLESTELRTADDLLEQDLSPLAAGRSLGWTPQDSPALLVCTHGRRDACCAERGRPVAAALAAAYPDETWECSHVGGHRFAANLVVLPEGLTYGRVAPTEAVTLVDRWRRGQVDPERMRGWVTQSPTEQATEVVVRRRLGLVDRADVTVATGTVRSDATDLAVRVGAGPHAGSHQVTTTPVPSVGEDGEPVLVAASCGDEPTAPTLSWDVGALR